MFRRILIANRGEIAVRVIRACREMGIESVAVYSDADTDALHVSLADHAVRLGPPPASASYLSVPSILAAARQLEVDAVHPGYGFLSEDAAFARRCAEAGVVFIGPPPEAIERMGSKIAARELARRAGVPLVEGDTPSDQSDDAVAASIRRVGFPALLKPSAGGGGIGMAIVPDEAALPGAIARGRREAIAAFGDGTLYVERLVPGPRHVEIQVCADARGSVLHLFERECSIQRRHQKVIEETPSTALTPIVRARMGEAAVALARAAGYQSVGTVEFLVEGSGADARYHFLEMNTRLQVEHPITELVTGVDLVRTQIAIAAGEPLPWPQEALAQRGHAIEARVYAEDPLRGHLPQPGVLLLHRAPSMPGVRIDAGVAEGDEVTRHYDPLLAKVIACGDTREIARARLIEALRAYPVLGVRTNIPFLIQILKHPRFAAGAIDTAFLDHEGPALRAALTADPPPLARLVASAAQAPGQSTPTFPVDPWSALDGFRA